MLDLTELSEAEKKARESWDIDLYRALAQGYEKRIHVERFIALSRNLCRPMILEIERLRKELKEANWILEGLRK